MPTCNPLNKFSTSSWTIWVREKQKGDVDDIDDMIIINSNDDDAMGDAADCPLLVVDEILVGCSLSQSLHCRLELRWDEDSGWDGWE